MLLPAPAPSVESDPFFKSLGVGVLVGFKLSAILLPQPPKSWDCSMGLHTHLSKALYGVMPSTGICLALLAKTLPYLLPPEHFLGDSEKHLRFI